MTASELPRRAAIPSEERWRVEDLYPDQEHWEEDFALVRRELEKAPAHRDLGKSAAALLAALRFQDEVGERLERVFVYAHLRHDEDRTDSAHQGLLERARSLLVAAQGALAFITPAVLDIPPERLEEFLARESGLELYRHKLEDIQRLRTHVRGAAEEELLAQAGELAMAPATVFRLLNDADLSFPQVRDEAGQEVALSHGRFLRFMESRDRRVRREAFEAMYAAYGHNVNTFAGLLNSSVKKDAFFARARRYPGALAAALDADRVPEAVYANLIDAVHAQLPQLHRYLALRRRLLGVDELQMYDLYVPLFPAQDRTIPYARAAETVREGMAPLGEEYARVLAEGLASGWVDVAENAGKASGAYSSGAYGVHPYVLLNYQGTLHDVFTLAHEMGHALHTHLSARRQPFVYADYSIFVAEVASTVNETLLLHHLLDTAADDAMRRYLLNHHLEQFRTTVFRQVMFAEFERSIHAWVEQGGALTPDYLRRAYRELVTAYHGPEVVPDEGIELEWARIPHFYSAFYVYKYATGFSAATALAGRILSGNAADRDCYLGFLGRGSSDYPVELLRGAGVDMAYPQPVAECLAAFAAALDRLEGLS